MDWKPVCGKNNVTYTNSCVARCENVTVARTGQCSKPGEKRQVHATDIYV